MPKSDATEPLATYRVGRQQAGLRLDLFLKTHIPKMSRTGLQKAIRERVVLPERRSQAKPGLIVHAGDVVVITRQEIDEPPIPDELIPRILHVDQDLIAVDKPSGLGVHASRRAVRSHLIQWLREQFDDSVALAHRLDRETSGVIVCTRNRQAARRLGRDFATGRLHKEYLAIVVGVPPAELVVDRPIGRDLDSLVYVKQRAGADQGAPAQTSFRLVRELPDRRALVRAYPKTGRRHQIRVHLAAAGYPIVGDKLYLGGDHAFLRFIERGLDQQMAAQLGARRQLLHAASLELRHPRTSASIRFEAPLPRDFQAVIEGSAGV